MGLDRVLVFVSLRSNYNWIDLLSALTTWVRFSVVTVLSHSPHLAVLSSLPVAQCWCRSGQLMLDVAYIWACC